MSSPLRQDKLLTVEEFEELSFEGKVELIDGVVVRSEEMPGAKHGRTALRVGRVLDEWAEAVAVGWAFVETGFVLGRDPDQVRIPDVSFVRREKLAELPDGNLPVVPDLAVEVLSPTDRVGDLEERLEDYRRFGVPLVWVVNPRTRTVIAHASSGLARLFQRDDLVDGGEVLPGFSCPLSRLFE